MKNYFKNSMLPYIYYIVLFFSYVCGFGQNYNSNIGSANDPTILGNVASSPLTRNINSEYGINFQDIKRSTALFIPDVFDVVGPEELKKEEAK